MLHCVIILNKWKIIVIWLTWNCLNEKLCETLTLISFKQVSCILKYKTWQKILAIFKYKPDETWPTFFLNTKNHVSHIYSRALLCKPEGARKSIWLKEFQRRKQLKARAILDCWWYSEECTEEASSENQEL